MGVTSIGTLVELYSILAANDSTGDRTSKDRSLQGADVSSFIKMFVSSPGSCLEAYKDNIMEYSSLVDLLNSNDEFRDQVLKLVPVEFGSASQKLSEKAMQRLKALKFQKSVHRKVLADLVRMVSEGGMASMTSETGATGTRSAVKQRKSRRRKRVSRTKGRSKSTSNHTPTDDMAARNVKTGISIEGRQKRSMSESQNTPQHSGTGEADATSESGVFANPGTEDTAPSIRSEGGDVEDGSIVTDWASVEVDDDQLSFISGNVAPASEGNHVRSESGGVPAGRRGTVGSAPASPSISPSLNGANLSFASSLIEHTKMAWVDRSGSGGDYGAFGKGLLNNVSLDESLIAPQADRQLVRQHSLSGLSNTGNQLTAISANQRENSDGKSAISDGEGEKSRRRRSANPAQTRSVHSATAQSYVRPPPKPFLFARLKGPVVAHSPLARSPFSGSPPSTAAVLLEQTTWGEKQNWRRLYDKVPGASGRGDDMITTEDERRTGIQKIEHFHRGGRIGPSTGYPLVGGVQKAAGGVRLERSFLQAFRDGKGLDGNAGTADVAETKPDVNSEKPTRRRAHSASHDERKPESRTRSSSTGRAENGRVVPHHGKAVGEAAWLGSSAAALFPSSSSNRSVMPDSGLASANSVREKPGVTAHGKSHVQVTGVSPIMMGTQRKPRRNSLGENKSSPSVEHRRRSLSNTVDPSVSSYESFLRKMGKTVMISSNSLEGLREAGVDEDSPGRDHGFVPSSFLLYIETRFEGFDKRIKQASRFMNRIRRDLKDVQRRTDLLDKREPSGRKRDDTLQDDNTEQLRKDIQSLKEAFQVCQGQVESLSQPCERE